MNTTRILSAVLFLATGSQAIRAADIAFPYAALFGEIKSVRCTAEASGERGPKYNPTHEPRRKFGDIQYALRGDQVYFDYVQRDARGAITWSQLYTFDGVRSSDFFRRDGNLNIYEGKTAGVAMNHFNLLLDAFSFVYRERFTSGFILTLREMSATKEWEDLTKVATLLPDEVIEGRRCRVVEVPGGKFPDPAKGVFSMRAWLDTGNHNYPVKWQRILTSTHKVAEEYQVEELGYLDEKKQIPYPKRAGFKSFDKEGELEGSSTLEIKEAVLNAPIDDELFTINPLLSKTVWDARTNTFIEMQKDTK